MVIYYNTVYCYINNIGITMSCNRVPFRMNCSGSWGYAVFSALGPLYGGCRSKVRQKGGRQIEKWVGHLGNTIFLSLLDGLLPKKYSIVWFLGVRIRVRWIHHIVGRKLNLLAGGFKKPPSLLLWKLLFLVEKIHVKKFVKQAIFPLCGSIF